MQFQFIYFIAPADIYNQRRIISFPSLAYLHTANLQLLLRENKRLRVLPRFLTHSFITSMQNFTLLLIVEINDYYLFNKFTTP